MKNFKMVFDVSQSGMDAVLAKAKALESQMGKMSSMKITNPVFDQTGAVTGGQITAAWNNMGAAAAKAKEPTNDFVNALRRAVIVAPIWMAARAAMQFFTKGLQEGFQYMIQFETAVYKLEQTLKAVGSTVNLETLKGEFIKLSQVTGQSTAQIATSYTTFIKAGIPIKDALALTTAAVDLQEVTFSKSEETIKAVALGYKLFGETLDKNLSTEEKATKISALLYQASNANLVSIEELSSEFTGSAGALKALGLTMEQSIGLLATLNSEGVKNVTGLKTALFRTFTDTANVAREFNLAIKPDTKPFEVFMMLLSKLQGAAKTGNIQGLGQALGEIFGKGGRGGTANVKILSDALDKLKSSISEGFSTDSVKRFKDALSEVNKTAAHQLEIWDNFRKQTFEGFIEGITGGKNFEEGLKRLNDLMLNQVIPIAKEYGRILNAIGLGVGTLGIGNVIATHYEALRLNALEDEKMSTRILAATTGKLNEKDYNTLLGELEKKQAEHFTPLKEKPVLGNVIDILKEHRKELIKTADTQDELTDAQKKASASEYDAMVQFNTKAGQKADKKTIQEKLNYAKATGLYTDTQILEIEKKAYELAGTSIDQTEKDLKLREIGEKLATTELKDKQDLIKHELELLRIRGASESELFKAETALKMQLLGVDEVKNSTIYQLELEKELTREKKAQSSLLGSDAVKIYHFAQKYGVEAAKEAAKLLQEPGTYKEFERRGMASTKAGLAEFFPGLIEQMSAQKYFGIGQYSNEFAPGRDISLEERPFIKQAERPIIWLPSGMATQGPVDESQVTGIRNLNQIGKTPALESPIVTIMKDGFKLITNLVKPSPVSIQSLQVNITPSVDSGKSKEEKTKKIREDIVDAFINDPKVIKAVEDIALGA